MANRTKIFALAQWIVEIVRLHSNTEYVYNNHITVVVLTLSPLFTTKSIHHY